MRRLNKTLTDILLKEEFEPTEGTPITQEDKKSKPEKPRFNENLGGETFQIDLDLSKKGLEMTFVPVNPEGTMILNLSEDELSNLSKSLHSSLSQKFQKVKMNLGEDKPNAEGKAVKLNIPIENMYDFIKFVIKSK